MDKSQGKSSNKKEGKNKYNNEQKIEAELQNKEPEKTNSKNANNINKKNKSNSSQTSKSKNNVDNLISNKDRYNELIKDIREYEDKLNNKETTNEKIPLFINQDNLEEQNNDINKLKKQLLNRKKDESKLIDFTNKIEELLSSRQYEFNDKIFEKTVSELFYKKYNLTKLNAFELINLIKTKNDIDFTNQTDYYKIMINDSNGNKEYIFFKDKDYYQTYYKNIFFLFEKNSQGIPNQINIFCNNFKYLTQFSIEKFGQNYIFPIYNEQLSEKFLEIETKKNKLRA